MILPLLLVAGKILSGVAAAAAVAAAIAIIKFEDVLARLRKHKGHDKDIGILVKQHLENGQVRVVGSVLSPHPLGVFPRKVRHTEVFEGKLDAQMEALFRQQQQKKKGVKIRV